MATTMPKFKRKLAMGANGRTNPLVWLVAIICTIIAVAVVVVGIAVFIGYMVIHPRVPAIGVSNAHLDLLRNDYAGLLQTQLTIVVTAKNGNAKAHATFSDISFNISYQGQDIAVLVADPFEVPKNSSKDLNFVVQSSSIPLNPDQMQQVDGAWKKNEIEFDFKGAARTQWRVGPLGSVKFFCHLDCDLKFHPLNGSYIPSPCTSKSK
ncbi:YLS9 protein [Spatholobus suberectus]|nr:YLS9 protein [Spatholobus suberectus]